VVVDKLFLKKTKEVESENTRIIIIGKADIVLTGRAER